MTARKCTLDAPNQPHEKAENQVHSIQKRLSFFSRIRRVDSLDGNRLVSKILSIDFADDLRTDFITRELEIQGCECIPRENFESGLRVGNDLSVDYVCHSIKNQICKNPTQRHAVRIQKAAADDHIKLSFKEMFHQGFDLRRIMLAIGIHRDDDIGIQVFRGSKPRDGCSPNSEIRQMTNNECSLLPRNMRRRIARAIVDNDADNFHTLNDRRNIGKNGADDSRLVMRRHNNSNRSCTGHSLAILTC